MTGMRQLVLPLGLAVIASISLAVACKGGPGNLEQGGDNGDQYGGIRQDTSGSRVTSQASSTGGSADDDDDEYTPPPSTTTTPTATTTTPKPPPPKDFRAADYDQSCSKDSDCKDVYEGAACQTCKCSNAAIANKDYGKYIVATSSANAACVASGTSSSSGDVSCAPCENLGKSHCNAAKRCAVGPNPNPPDGG